ncbi:P63C domain-containing protein [Elizabethkingia meningoseptica]|uniref:P63C domain-containing protein n=1 Tax=Elizabethkingia meningoseptica TaxID=238 RepID=UPI0023B0C956|nr:P63C domain-containing protein [Elizabethkingia meningoseptica]MDE5490650.1 P63C domain-containing protein [Elizabethkingia meningoseptica]
MAKKNIDLFATHSSDKTPLIIGDVEIPAYVLNNGMRVFSQSGIQKALGYVGSSGDWLPNFVNSKQLQLEKNAGLYDSISKRVQFDRLGAGGSVSTTYGYDVTVLIDICDAIIESKNAGKLNPKYKIYAERAEIIMRSVAKVGIVALVDEATGYQYEREKDALQVILKAYINEELIKWQKMFPDTFYYEIFRLKNWDFTVSGIKKRPGVIGKWTNELIYKQLPKGVLDELKSKTPKSKEGNYTARFFQSLTPDIGHPALTAQIYKVIGLMNISNTWDEFKSHFNRMVDRNNGQMEIDFESVENSIDIDDESVNKLDKEIQSTFNFSKNDN